VRGPLPLVETLPEFAAELGELLRTSGRDELAGAVSELRVHACCGCGRRDCQSFYTVDPTAWPDLSADGTNVVFDSRDGLIVLDVAEDGSVLKVEVIGHEELRPAYLALCLLVGRVRQ
jgi:hypothetical protein